RAGRRAHGHLRVGRPQGPRRRREPADVGARAGRRLHRRRHRPVSGVRGARGVGGLDGPARGRDRLDPGAGRRGPALLTGERDPAGLTLPEWWACPRRSSWTATPATTTP